jgi:hypothetical protein
LELLQVGIGLCFLVRRGLLGLPLGRRKVEKKKSEE